MIKQSPSGFLPLSDPQWQQWLQETQATGNALKWIDPTNPQFGRVEPLHTRGLLGIRERHGLEPGQRRRALPVDRDNMEISGVKRC